MVAGPHDSIFALWDELTSVNGFDKSSWTDNEVCEGVLF